MRALAIETVGTQEIQGGLFDHWISREIGINPRVEGRRVGEELADLSDDDLEELLSLDVLRNGACYAELDARYGGEWMLALLATDQEPAHVSDTIGIARAISRWLSRRQPAVAVLPTLELRCPPHDPSDELAREIESQVRGALDACEPETVVVLPVGGTPAMRLLTERAVGLAFPGEQLRLVPDGGGGAVEGGLLRIVEADGARAAHLASFRDSLRTGRFHSARTLADTFETLGIRDARKLAAWAEVAQRIADDEEKWTTKEIRAVVDQEPLAKLQAMQSVGFDGWHGTLMARISTVRRMEKDGRLREAVFEWVTATELLPVVWALECFRPARAKELLALPAGRCRDESRPPASRQPNVVDRARDSAICAQRWCKICPLRSAKADEPAFALGADRRRGAAASFLRDTGPKALIRVRNELAHRRGRGRGEIGDAMATIIDGATQVGMPVTEQTLAGILRAAYFRIVNEVPGDPFAVIEAEVERLVGPHGPRRGVTPVGTSGAHDRGHPD